MPMNQEIHPIPSSHKCSTSLKLISFLALNLSFLHNQALTCSNRRT